MLAMYIFPMAMYLIKLLVSAGMIVLISEVSKKSAHLGALVGSLPLVSLIAITWIFIETNDIKRIQDHSIGVFWYVLPSLIFFVLFPFCLNKMHFWWSMAISIFATFLAYLVMVWILARFGMKL